MVEGPGSSNDSPADCIEEQRRPIGVCLSQRPDMNPHAERLRLLKNPHTILRTCLDPLSQSRRDRFSW
jgi:hypothetical protein